MKFMLIVLFLWLNVFAENMSIAPYNNPEFKTQIQREEEKAAYEKAAELKNQKALERYEKRMKVLKKREKKAEAARQAKAKKKRLQEEAKAQELRNIQARQKIQENLLQAKEQKKEKALYEKEEEKRLDQQKAIALNEEEEDFTLVPEQADISVNNPDDIQTELDNVNRLRYLLLHSKNTPQSVKDYILFLNNLNKNYNLDVSFSYRSIAQSELNEDIASAGGKYDMTVRYRPQESTDIALRIEGRNQIGSYSSNEFKQEIGSLSSTSASYRNEDLYLAQLWIEQDINDFIIRAGKIDPTSFIDSHQFKSSSRFFFNGTFSASPYNSFPPLGLGIAGKYHKDRYYISAEATDSNAVSGGSNNDVFKEHKFYTALEVGVTPKDSSKYHMTAWHRDSSQNQPEAKGVILSAVQTLSADTHLIIRGAASDNATAKRYASLGIGQFSLFKEHDISGLAIGTLVPSNATERTQTTLESFYRMDPLPGIQLSADLQFIYHPSRSEQTWAVLPGIRLRVLF